MLIIDFKRYIAPELAMLISAGVGAASTAINAGVNADINEKNAERQRQANLEAYKHQKELLLLQEGYNSPSNQVARLRSAGLNPALMYGNGSASTGNVDSIPSPAPVGVSYDRPLDFAGGMADSVRLALSARQQLNENDLAISKIALESAQGFELVTKGGLNLQQAKQIVQDMGFDLLRFPLEVDKIKQEISESESREKVNYKTLEVSDAQISEISARTGLTEAETARIVALLPAELALMDAQTALAWTQSAEGRARITDIVARLDLDRDKFSFDKTDRTRHYEWTKYNDLAERSFRREENAKDRSTSVVGQILHIGATAVGASGVVAAAKVRSSH